MSVSECERKQSSLSRVSAGYLYALFLSPILSPPFPLLLSLSHA